MDNTEEYEKMIEEATVDCHDEEEVFSGIVCMLQDELEFPFDAKIIGKTVKVLDVNGNESRLGNGVMMDVSFEGKKYVVALSTMEIVDEDSKNSKWFGAYKYWIKQ